MNRAAVGVSDLSTETKAKSIAPRGVGFVGLKEAFENAFRVGSGDFRAAIAYDKSGASIFAPKMVADRALGAVVFRGVAN